MPLYEFSCESCGPFEQRRSFAEANEPMLCPSCQTIATRAYTLPGLYKTSKAERIARSRNEKSAHEPRVERRSMDERGTSSNHHHHHPTRHHGPHRPWMLGH